MTCMCSMGWKSSWSMGYSSQEEPGTVSKTAGSLFAVKIINKATMRCDTYRNRSHTFCHHLMHHDLQMQDDSFRCRRDDRLKPSEYRVSYSCYWRWRVGMSVFRSSMLQLGIYCEPYPFTCEVSLRYNVVLRMNNTDRVTFAACDPVCIQFHTMML